MSTLFNTVPEKDYGGFFQSGEVDSNKVIQYLNYKKKDVAEATGIPQVNIRYEPKKIPPLLLTHIKEWAVAINLVAGFFNDVEKTALWFQIRNPLLGGVSPRGMIRMGRFNKLSKFIQTALDENARSNPN